MFPSSETAFAKYSFIGRLNGNISKEAPQNMKIGCTKYEKMIPSSESAFAKYTKTRFKMPKNSKKCVLCGRSRVVDKVKLFRFPSYERKEVLAKWLTACQLTENDCYSYLEVCNHHFNACDFFLSGRLKKDAWPSLNLDENFERTAAPDISAQSLTAQHPHEYDHDYIRTAAVTSQCHEPTHEDDIMARTVTIDTTIDSLHLDSSNDGAARNNYSNGRMIIDTTIDSLHLASSNDSDASSNFNMTLPVRNKMPSPLDMSLYKKIIQTININTKKIMILQEENYRLTKQLEAFK